jgi:hypothetical protein
MPDAYPITVKGKKAGDPYRDLVGADAENRAVTRLRDGADRYPNNIPSL